MMRAVSVAAFLSLAAACSSSTGPSEIVPNGVFALDSIAGHRLPAFDADLGNLKVYLLGRTITMLPGMYYAASERDSLAYSPNNTVVGPSVVVSNSSGNVTVSGGTIQLTPMGLPGRVVDASHFTLADSTFGIMFYSKIPGV